MSHVRSTARTETCPRCGVGFVAPRRRTFCKFFGREYKVCPGGHETTVSELARRKSYPAMSQLELFK